MVGTEGSEKTVSWRDEVDALRKICELEQIDALVERSRSGQGAHVWIFFSEPVSAQKARQFGTALLTKGAEVVTSDSDFMQSSCRLQSGLRSVFWDWLHLAASLPSVPTIV